MRQLLDTRAVYIVPALNPDGAELALADRPRHPLGTPLSLRRAAGRRADGGRRGRRRPRAVHAHPDPHGTWKKCTRRPRLMVPREPGEFGGSYYRVMPEGLLKNWDGLQIKVNPTAKGWT